MLTSRCPEEPLLQQLLLGAVPEPAAALLGRHLLDCPDCASAASRLQLVDPLVHAARAARRLAETPPDDTEQLLADRMSLPELAAPAGAEPACLNPPEQADELGRLGSYRVLRLLGAGGMGMVFHAEEPRLQRPVALKLMRPRFAGDAAARRRFLREARAMAALRHDHVAAVFEVGEDNGVPYLAMELLHGATLADWLRAGLPPVAEAVRLCREAAEALAAAHEQGLIHRDIKPANLWREAPSGRLKLLDFGLARAPSEPPTPTALLTETGVVLGTPSYMAPEQAQNQDVGPAADVYALGAVLYECLTGRPPFQAASSLDTVLLLLNEEPVTPSRLNPTVPRDLETICLKCLEKQPSRRYGSAAELADDLRRFQNGEPIAARRAGRLERGVKWVRRRPAVAALLAALVAVTAVGFAGVTWKYLDAQDEARQKETQRSAAELARADALAQEAEAKRQLLQAETARYVLQIATAQHALEASDYPRALEILAGCAEKLRHFEYDYLRGRCRRLGASHRLYRDGMGPVAFAADGRRLVTARMIRTDRPNLPPEEAEIKLWDAPGGQELGRFRCPGTAVTHLAVSPDGSLVSAVTGSKNLGRSDTLRLWDVRTGKERVCVTLAETVYFTPPLFSPDGKYLAVGRMDKVVEVWDAVAGRSLFTLEKHAGAVSRLAFSGDSRRLVAGGSHSDARRDRCAEVKVWDVLTGREQRTLTQPGHLTDLALPPAGTHLAASLQEVAAKPGPSRVVVWDVRQGSVVWTFEGAGRLGFSGDGRRLVACGHPAPRLTQLKAWDLTQGKEVFSVQAHAEQAHLTALSPDGKLTATYGGSGMDSEIKVWNAESGTEVFRARGYEHNSVLALSFSADGQRLYSALNEGLVRVWDARPEPALMKRTPGQLVGRLAISPDGRRIAVGRGKKEEPELRVLEAVTGRVLFEFAGDDTTAASLAFSPDGRKLAWGGYDGRVRVCVPEAGQGVVSVQAHATAVWQLEFSGDGRRLASVANGDPVVKVWDTGMGQEVAAFKHSSPHPHVALSSAGRLLALGGATDAGSELTVWDLDSRREVLTRHEAKATGVCSAFSPDDRFLATTVSHGQPQDAPGAIDLWEVATGTLVKTFVGTNHDTMSLAFSQDGKRLAANGVHDMKLWDTSTGQQVLSLRQITTGTWVRFSPDGKRLTSGGTSRQVLLWDGNPSMP